MSIVFNEDHKKWYESQRSTYELLSNSVKNILESLVRNAGIDYLTISTRAKEIDSFVEKVIRKSYKNPVDETTDLAGIRIITYIETDALKVNELIKNAFDVDESKSLDKSNELGIDKFGYRSFHFVCGLGKSRCDLPEFAPFKKLVCEIQVRTVLQHAWAEIEHDRNYKFAGTLPSQIKRRLHLLAGLLELADGEFNNLSKDIDNYSEENLLKTKSGNLNIEINSISLEQYLNESETVTLIVKAAFLADYGYIEEVKIDFDALIMVANHLKISTIGEIDKILKSGQIWAQILFTELRKFFIVNPTSGNKAWYVLFVIVASNIKYFTKRKLSKLKWSDEFADEFLRVAKSMKQLK